MYVYIYIYMNISRIYNYIYLILNMKYENYLIAQYSKINPVNNQLHNDRRMWLAHWEASTSAQC